MGCAVFDGSFQLWPSTLGQWFTGDSIVIGFDDVYLKESAPYQFTIATYNDDTLYDHLINVRIGIVSKEIFMARFLPSMTYKYYSDMLAVMNTEQQEAQKIQAEAIIASPFSWLKDVTD